MRELAPGVIHIPTSKNAGDNAFLVEGDDGYTLVDVGWKNSIAVLRAAVASRRRHLTDIKRIVITHAHPDHVRGLAEFARLTKAAVHIHHLDADWLRTGRVPTSGRSGTTGKLLDRLPLLHWTPVDPDVLLEDGNHIPNSGGLRVIHTPGHSPGHIVLLHEPSSTLLTGDAVFHRGSRLTTGHDTLAYDTAERDQSLTRLPRDVAAVGFAHGDPASSGEVEKFLRWLSTRTPGSSER